MPDRELTEEETRKLLGEPLSGYIFQALKVFQEENTKPSLHDLCILELQAAADGMKRIIIAQGRALKSLERQVKELQKK